MVTLRTMDDKSADFKQLTAVYEEAFPPIERLPLWFMKMRARTGQGEFVGIYDDDEWVGFAYNIVNAKLAYVLFLAIDPAKREHGYGSQALAALKERYAGQQLALSAERPDEEAPNAEQRVRRLNFYQRNGFNRTGFASKEKEGLEYELLAHGEVKVQDFLELMAQFTKQRQRYFLPIKMIEVPIDD